ncbi:MAG: hypothetical protein IPP69_16640 [Flavobacteriales bacterium]|nr:hypothetical protein [Flavobacteriales bacterium]
MELNIPEFHKQFDSIAAIWQLFEATEYECRLLNEYQKPVSNIGAQSNVYCLKSKRDDGLRIMLSKHYMNKTECMVFIALYNAKTEFVSMDRVIGDRCTVRVNGP